MGFPLEGKKKHLIVHHSLQNNILVPRKFYTTNMQILILYFNNGSCSHLGEIERTLELLGNLELVLPT